MKFLLLALLGGLLNAYGWIDRAERAKMDDFTIAEIIGGVIMVLGLILAVLA